MFTAFAWLIVDGLLTELTLGIRNGYDAIRVAELEAYLNSNIQSGLKIPCVSNSRHVTEPVRSVEDCSLTGMGTEAVLHMAHYKILIVYLQSE